VYDQDNSVSNSYKELMKMLANIEQLRQANKEIKTRSASQSLGLSSVDFDNLSEISDAVYSRSASLRAVFKRLDANHDGSLSALEFVRGVKKLGLNKGVSDQQLAKLARTFDNDKNGIQYKEFVRMLAASQNSGMLQ
jgi:Ca2+-binding EF-hand superfamily protein